MNRVLEGSILKLDLQGAFFVTFLSNILGSLPAQDGRPQGQVLVSYHLTEKYGNSGMRTVQSQQQRGNVFFFFADYENFCQILLQRPFAWGSAGMLFTTRVTEEDLAIMTKLAQGHFYKVITILKQLPRSMLLVFR